MPAATPANSAQSVPRFAISRAPSATVAASAPVALADQRKQALAGDDPHPDRQLVKDDERDGRERQHPQQLVSVVRAELRVGRDPGGIVVGETGEDARADDREQHDQRAPADEVAAPANKSPVQVAPDRARRRSLLINAGWPRGVVAHGASLSSELGQAAYLVTWKTLRTVGSAGTFGA